MSMSFGGGDPYAALVQALQQRRQQMQAPQPMQPGQPMGGQVMQMQPQQFGVPAAAGQNAMGAAMGGMPSAASMAQMLKQMRGAWGGQSEFATTSAGSKVPVVDAIRPADQAAPDPGLWSRFSSMFSSGS